MGINIDTIPYDSLSWLAGNNLQQTVSYSSKPSFLQNIKNLKNLFPSFPYSAKYIRQDEVANIKGAITKTETQRLLGLHGDDGMFACRIADGWSTIPSINIGGRFFLASRSILRLNNITIFRNNPKDYKLECSMIGPNHYFGVLDNTHEYCCTIQYNNNGIPFFVREKTNIEQNMPVNQIPEHYITTIDSALWLSGKKYALDDLFDDKEVKKINKQSLTQDLGKLIFEIQENELKLARFNALKFDLSPFGARLVKNNIPFKITHSSEDSMDVVTYHFGKKYSETIVQNGVGLFLETHDFTQIMSPMTKYSGGFICLARWKNNKLQLIGVEVPYGYSIIVSKGAIHGDSTFIGNYLMAMTVNHNTMATADVVFLRNKVFKNIILKLETNNYDESNELLLEKNQDISFNNINLKPLVIMPEGELKAIFDADIKHQKKPLDKAVKTGSAVIYNPFNSAEKEIKAM